MKVVSGLSAINLKIDTFVYISENGGEFKKKKKRSENGGVFVIFRLFWKMRKFDSNNLLEPANQITTKGSLWEELEDFECIK